MRLLSVLPLTLILAACGGGSGGSGSNGDGLDLPDIKPPVTGPGAQAIDCSIDKSKTLAHPLPEYPGYSRPDGDIGGFDPQAMFEIAAAGLLLTMSKSEEGFLHTGPTWTIIDGNVTRTIRYQQDDSDGESWTVLLNGSEEIDGETVVYDDRKSLEIFQHDDCNLEYNTYHKTNGSLETKYTTSSVYESLHQAFDSSGRVTAEIRTKVAADRSGVSLAIDKEPPISEHPVTETTWDSQGNVLETRFCTGYQGYTASGCVASSGG